MNPARIAADGYTVVLRRDSDGETREYVHPLPWEDHHVFMWTDGNYGCDCNRAIFFAEAGGEPRPLDPPCGEEAYSVVEVRLPTGEAFEIE